MSRSYPRGGGKWRMYCDACDHIDPDRFDRQPPLALFVAKGWLIGKLTDRCPACRDRADLKPMEPHSIMASRGAALEALMRDEPPAAGGSTTTQGEQPHD